MVINHRAFPWHEAWINLKWKRQTVDIIRRVENIYFTFKHFKNLTEKKKRRNAQQMHPNQWSMTFQRKLDEAPSQLAHLSCIHGERATNDSLQMMSENEELLWNISNECNHYEWPSLLSMSSWPRCNISKCSFIIWSKMCLDSFLLMLNKKIDIYVLQKKLMRTYRVAKCFIHRVLVRINDEEMNNNSNKKWWFVCRIKSGIRTKKG